jgi:hypothetical protein
MLAPETIHNPSAKRLALDPRKNIYLPITGIQVRKRVQQGINPLANRGGLSVARWLAGGRLIER